ncbi:MAG: TetR/AcrR family transcriptional regulator [Fidelibacterota bacterium]
MKNFTNRQNEIINAAVELIAEKGIQQLTIKNLSGKIGIVEGGIYRHFKSKIDILLSILVSFENRIGSANETLLFSADENALTKLKTIFLNTFKNFKANPALAAVIFSEEIFQNDKRLSEKVFAIMQQHQAILQKIILIGQQSDHIRSDIPVKHLTLMITGTLRLIVTQWRLTGFTYDLESEGEQMWYSIKKILTN